MNDPRNHELSRIYREGAWPEPSQQLDDAILEASRRAARARRAKSFVWRFGTPFALAATVVLTFTWVLRMYEEQPQVFAPAPGAKKRAAPAAAQPAASRAAEAKPAPAPQPALDLNAARLPAPVAAPAATALKKEQPARGDSLDRGYAPLEERARPPEPLLTPVPAAPAQPGESASAPSAPVPAAGAVSGAAGGAASRAIALERTPQAWLDEIRKLKAQGRGDDAERELAAFTKRYPDYQLPDDLR